MGVHQIENHKWQLIIMWQLDVPSLNTIVIFSTIRVVTAEEAFQRCSWGNQFNIPATFACKYNNNEKLIK